MFVCAQRTKRSDPRGMEMPKTRRERPLARTQKAKKVRPGAPLLETRARSILSTMVTEVAAEPEAGLQLPEAPAAEPVADAAVHSIDDLPTSALAAIARQGASLELDGTKHDADALAELAENVTDDAHLKINNAGSFTAEELASIARSAPGQVILA